MKLFDGIKWVWFDLDDTLYNFAASSLWALDQLYERHNLAEFFANEQEWFDTYHRHNSALWDLYNRGLVDKDTLRHERFFRPLFEVGASETTANRLTAILDGEYLDLLGSTGLKIEGAKALLKSLRENGMHIGILSNGFLEVQNRKLQTAGLEPYIDCVVLSDEIGINKPDRRLYDYALKKSGATAQNSLMIGDNADTDIAGAYAAGWRSVLFCPKGEPAANNHADAVVSRLEEIATRWM